MTGQSEVARPRGARGRVLVVVAERDMGSPSPEDPTDLPSWVGQLCTQEPSDAVEAVAVVGFSVAPRLDTDDSARSCLHTWELLDRLERVDVVHVCRPATAAGEVAVLAAKTLRKRLVVSDLAARDSTLGLSVGMLDLADVLVCESNAEAEFYRGHPGVHLLDLRSSPAELQTVYAALSPHPFDETGGVEE